MKVAVTNAPSFGENFEAFVVSESYRLDADLFDLPKISKNIYIVNFRAAEGLEEPNTDVIGVYSYAGMKRYIWRDMLWQEYNADLDLIKSKLFDLIRDSRESGQVSNVRNLICLLNKSAMIKKFAQVTIDVQFRLIYSI